jgi:Xaa-Pro aminopeptidase
VNKEISLQSNPEVSLTTPTDRRLDVEGKQARVAGLLQESGCDGLLCLDPANFSWLTSGGMARGSIDPTAAPALYFTNEGRWLLSANVDTQRLFDEELDGLGFQLKEWPWPWGRDQLLGDLCVGRKVACDVNFGDAVAVGNRLRLMRCKLSAYEQACYRALGQVLGHALEATCRSLNPNDTEREAAGMLSHRLVHRGAYPLHVSAMADGRAALYRQGGFTPAPIKAYCMLTAAAQKYGLCALASRSFCFGEPPANYRAEHDAACRVAATYTASSWPDAVPSQVFATALRVYALTGAEHEWRLCPQGHVTARNLVEFPLFPDSSELFQVNWAVTWRASIGAAVSCDTFLITEDGPRTISVSENWPLKRIRVQGAEFVRPDLLVR